MCTNTRTQLTECKYCSARRGHGNVIPSKSHDRTGKMTLLGTWRRPENRHRFTDKGCTNNQDRVLHPMHVSMPGKCTCIENPNTAATLTEIELA